MDMKLPVAFFFKTFFTGLFLVSILLQTASYAQFVKDNSYVLEFPDIVDIAATPLHFYVLSEEDGLIVFRNKGDSLIWMYNTEGMSQRGRSIKADARFAYLIDDNNRISVVEPSSILGVFSSNKMDVRVQDVARLEDHLFVAALGRGIQSLSLTSSGRFAELPKSVFKPSGTFEEISMLHSDGIQLFALSTKPALYLFEAQDDSLVLNQIINLKEPLNCFFLDETTIYGVTKNGDFGAVRADGSVGRLFKVDPAVNRILKVEQDFWFRSPNGKIFVAPEGKSIITFRETNSGNLMTASKNHLWVSEFNRLQKIIQEPLSDSVSSSTLPKSLLLKPVENRIVSYPHPLIMAFATEEMWPPDQIQFYVRHPISEIDVAGKTMYWQPQASQIGRHQLTVIATTNNGLSDSTIFSVDVRPFNAPPRFAPLRPVTIPMNEPFELPITAIDPDAQHKNLIRYIGVDLPEGANLDEKKGVFSWTPLPQHEGEHRFQVIATDQFGAAASMDVKVLVKNITR